MSLKALVLLFAVVVSVSALTAPRSPYHHRALAHRAAVVVPAQPVLRRRTDGKRCRPRPSSSLPALPSSSLSAPPSPTPPSPNPVPSPKPPTAPKNNPAPPPNVDPTPSPKPATTPQPQPTTTPQPQPATTKASGGGGGGGLPSFMTGTQTGQGTFYSTGLGACGIVNKDTDYIAAVSHLLFDAFPSYNGVNPNNNPICGRKVSVSFEGKTVVVALTDRCEGCQLTDLDFSPSAFNQLADFARGRIGPISWVWL